MSITLKDRNAVDKVFTKVAQTGNTVEFTCAGTNLQNSMSLALTLKKNSKTNRIVGRLTVPTTHVPSATGLEEVAYTEVGSFDLSAVRFASAAAAEDFVALFSSLLASASVESMYLSGTMPS